MKKWLVLFTVMLSVILTVPTADAKKLGGGRSFGKSYSTTPAKPAAAPSSTQANKSSTANSANKNQQQPQKKSGFFGGMLGGLLAGGLLASLFGGLGGLGGGIGGLFGLLIIGLLAFGLIKVFRSMKSGTQQKARPHYAGGHNQSHNFETEKPFEAEKPPFDNSFEQSPPKIRDMLKSGMLPGDAPLPGNEPLSGNATLPGNEPLAGGFSQPSDVPYNLPPNFDMNGFLQGAREHYRTLQQAWNTNNLDTMQDYVSPELFNALRQERETLTGEQHTEVMYVDAELVRADYNQRAAEVSIRFNGRYCDRTEGVEEDITDIWHLERDLTVANAPWYIVGIES